MKVWVVDAASLIEIREIIPREPAAHRNTAYKKLDELVVQGRLYFPKQVLGELERGATPNVKDPHDPYTWAKRYDKLAKRFGDLFTEAAAVEAEVDDLVDPEATGPDPADPYVIAYAEKLRAEGHDVTIITDDRKKPPGLTALSVAAGHFNFPSVNMRQFLKSQGIWPVAQSAT